MRNKKDLGGRAISENQRIMDIVPTELHQRVPFFVGSKNMIDHLEENLEINIRPNSIKRCLVNLIDNGLSE